VKLATQVLSTSVAIALEECGYAYVLATAKFCKMMNDFFDCTNVMSMTEYVSKRNQFVKPYTCQDDERFSWLKDVFLGYWIVGKIRQWQEMTYKGLKISVYSHIEAIQFLLAQGFQYVLSERFMQDVVEDYFGHQRAKGG
ncbi:Hypothetical predicted protein, partial [Paramuricea clavata]